MSLSTVAAPLRPDEALLKLPASRPERFQRSDFVAAGLVFLITLGVYIATLAPNVTLLDSGELITAAATFGVGHPRVIRCGRCRGLCCRTCCRSGTWRGG